MDKKAGFEVTADRPMGPTIFWLEVAPKGVQTRLVLYPKSMMQGSEGMKVSIVFECENVMETYKTLKENGVSLMENPELLHEIHTSTAQTLGLFEKEPVFS